MSAILAFLDTEGTPHRQNSTSSLWDLGIIAKYVIDAESFEIKEKIFHLLNFAHEKNSPRQVVRDPLKSHWASLRYIMAAHECDRIYVCAWNMPHDKAVINFYGDEFLSDFGMIDVLPWYRKTVPGLPSYSLDSLVDCKKGAHTGIGDVHRMIKLAMAEGDEAKVIKSMKPFLKQSPKFIKIKPVHTRKGAGGSVFAGLAHAMASLSLRNST